MRQLARRASPPSGALSALRWALPFALVAAAVLGWALPALATPAATPPAAPCPAGLAKVASWEPIEVEAGRATVAFVLAPGCQGVDMSLVSYQTRQAGAAHAPVLHAVTGRFSAGTVNRLTALVGSDCAFRVVFATGRPDTVGQPGTVVEASMQLPDPCMFGAAPVVVTAPTTTTTPPTTLVPATTLAPKALAAGRPAPAAPAPLPAPARSVTRTPATRAAAPAPARAAATTAPEPPATRPPSPTTISGLASEPVAAVGVGPSGPLAGWDAASLFALAGLTLGAGVAVLWAARAPRPAPAHARSQRGRRGRRRARRRGRRA
jgi:hypothetical protein